MEKHMPHILIPGTKGVTNYINALIALGAEPELSGAPCEPSGFDGLLLPGGADIDPSRYNQSLAGARSINRKLDELQFTVLDSFVKAGKPVFGICRGQQLLNVYFGGTLIQDLSKEPTDHTPVSKTRDGRHDIGAVTGSWLEILCGSVFSVNSVHHQATDLTGDGLVVDARADDGVIEAMHHSRLPIWSVQYHPERMYLKSRRADEKESGSAVLRFFIEQCSKYAAE